MKYLKILAILISIMSSSCSYYNARYLQYYDKDENYTQNQIGDKAFLKNNYIIREGDELIVSVSTLSKAELNFLNQASVGQNGAAVQGAIPYRVKLDGTIVLPKIGAVLVRGFSVEQAEKIVGEELVGYLENPVVRVDVSSFSVTVINETGGGQRVEMVNGTLTILEAIAQANAVKETSRTKSVKIIRQIGFKNYIYEVDITDVNLVYSTNYFLFPNDIVYLEPTFMGNFKLSNLQELIGFISAAIVIYTFVGP